MMSKKQRMTDEANSQSVNLAKLEDESIVYAAKNGEVVALLRPSASAGTTGGEKQSRWSAQLT